MYLNFDCIGFEEVKSRNDFFLIFSLFAVLPIAFEGDLL